MIDLAASLRTYLVADPAHTAGEFLPAVEAALRGGVSMVQLRAKGLTDRELLAYANALRDLCTRFDALFVMNDRVDIAVSSKADGVHLGVDDLPLQAARELGGPEMVIGFSPETDDQLRSAKDLGANYLGIGPVFGTLTKADAGEALGLDEFRRRMLLGGLPTVGIGGVSINNAPSVIQAGAAGVAVISAVLGVNDPEHAARQLSRNS